MRKTTGSVQEVSRTLQVASQLRVLDSVRERVVRGEFKRFLVVTVGLDDTLDFGWSSTSATAGGMRLMETLGALDMLADRLRRDAYEPCPSEKRHG